MLQNAYFLAKIGADTAENEQHFAENLPKIGNYPTGPPGPRPAPGCGARAALREGLPRGSGTEAVPRPRRAPALRSAREGTARRGEAGGKGGAYVFSNSELERIFF